MIPDTPQPQVQHMTNTSTKTLRDDPREADSKGEATAANNDVVRPLRFGAMSEPLHRQLSMARKTCEHWQKDADAITRLVVRGLITASIATAARRRLVQRMAADTKAEGR